MTLTAKVNSTVGPSVAYTGFPDTKPLQATSNNITITPNRVVDYYGIGNANSGFYLTSKNIITASGLVAGNTVNTLMAIQTFKNLTTSNASVPFYYDTPVITAPTGSIDSLSISSSTRVSGVSIYNNPSGSITPTIAVNATASNMGTYFYRSPLITYNYKINDTLVTTNSEPDLTNVLSSDISGNMFKTGTLRFAIPPYTLPTGTTITNATTFTVNASENNIYGLGALTSKSFSVITDAASVTFVNTTIPSSIPTLGLTAAPVIGCRVWSAPSVSNYCPDLSFNTIMYHNCLYDDSWDITSTSQPSANGLINTSTELMIKNGLFTTETSAYINYIGTAGNSTINYSSIGRTATDYRFVTFCWKLEPRTTTAYKTLKFTFNSINKLTPVYTGYMSLGINDLDVANILVFYAFQESSQPSVKGKYNTGWLNANFASTNAPGANSTSVRYDPVSTVGRYGTVNSQIAAILPNNTTSTTTTLSVFIPTVTPTLAATYLYLRIGVPMSNNNIQFGSVSATLTA